MKRIVTETAAQTYALRMRNSLSFGKGSVLLSSSSPLNQEASRAVRFGSRRGFAAAFRPQQGKKNDVTDRGRIRQQHRQAVDANAFAGRRRHTMAESTDVIHVELLRDIVAALRNLRKKAPLLLGRVVQLGEAVRHFHSRNVYFESFCQRWIFRLLFRKWRNIGRKIVKNRGLDKFVFGHGFEKESCPLAVLQRAFGCGVRRTGALGPQVIASCHFLSAARRG